MAIRAIETRYKGYRFRSRLEVRWAVYFDAVGLKWDYELEGFHLPSGEYLPDFWLSTIQMWAEVKAKTFSDGEKRLARELAQMTGRPVFMLAGVPSVKPYPAYMAGGVVVDHEVHQYRREARAWASYAPDDLIHWEKLAAGVSAARAARFEHGERP